MRVMLITIAYLVVALAASLVLHRYITHTRVMDRIARLSALDTANTAHYTREEKQKILSRSASFERLTA